MHKAKYNITNTLNRRWLRSLVGWHFRPLFFIHKILPPHIGYMYMHTYRHQWTHQKIEYYTCTHDFSSTLLLSITLSFILLSLFFAHFHLSFVHPNNTIFYSEKFNDLYFLFFFSYKYITSNSFLLFFFFPILTFNFCLCTFLKYTNIQNSCCLFNEFGWYS